MSPAPELNTGNIALAETTSEAYHVSDKMWYEITYPFRNLNGCNAEVSEWINNSIPHFIMDVISFLC